MKFKKFNGLKIKQPQKPNMFKRFFTNLRELYLNDAEFRIATLFGDLQGKRSAAKSDQERDREERAAYIINQLKSPKYLKYFYRVVNYQKKRKPTIIEIKIKSFLEQVVTWCIDKYFYLFERKVWIGRKKLLAIKKTLLYSHKKMDDFINSLNEEQCRAKLKLYNMPSPEQMYNEYRFDIKDLKDQRTRREGQLFRNLSLQKPELQITMEDVVDYLNKEYPAKQQPSLLDSFNKND